MVRGYIIEKSTSIISQYYLKAVKRVKSVPKKMMADDGNKHSFIEPIHIYLSRLNDNTGDGLHSFSIMPSPVNQRIESYWSKFVVDRPGWWKSFFQYMVDLEIFDSKWTRFIGLYQVWLYEYSTKRTYRHCKWMESPSTFDKQKQHTIR